MPLLLVACLRVGSTEPIIKTIVIKVCTHKLCHKILLPHTTPPPIVNSAVLFKKLLAKIGNFMFLASASVQLPNEMNDLMYARG